MSGRCGLRDAPHFPIGRSAYPWARSRVKRSAGWIGVDPDPNSSEAERPASGPVERGRRHTPGHPSEDGCGHRGLSAWNHTSVE
jgi:hypothetical protein